MSSRRAVGEDNILAMLERDSARRSGTRTSNLRLAWYGTAAAFAGILAGGVAWLAYDNHKGAGQIQTEQETTLAAVPPMLSGAGAPARPDVSMLPIPPSDMPRPAVIVDEAAPPARVAGNAVPPLVMLTPHEAGTKRPAEQAGQTANAAPRAATTTTTTTTTTAAAAAASNVPPLLMLPRDEAAAARPPAKPAAQASRSAAGATPAKAPGIPAAARDGDKKADKPQRPAARIAKAGPQRSATKTAADSSRKPKPAPAAPQVDSDVALISAIISQSERHRGERKTPVACSGSKCPQKPAEP